MKNRSAITAILAVLAFVSFGTFAEAQNDFVFDGVENIVANEADNNGRPDPTNRGRYTEYGSEVKYPGAEILPEGTPGIQCNPASEMVGATVLNTTKPGYAMKVVLTDKAEIALVNGKTYLCHCAKGYNRLFLVQQDQPASSIASAANARVRRDSGGDITVIFNNNPTVPVYEQREPFQPSTIFCQNIQAKNYNQPGLCRYGGGHTTRNVLIGVGIVALGTGIYFATQDDNKPPDVDTDGKCVATKYPNSCPKPGAPGVGASSAPQGFSVGFVPQGIGFSFTIRR